MRNPRRVLVPVGIIAAAVLAFIVLDDGTRSRASVALIVFLLGAVIIVATRNRSQRR